MTRDPITLPAHVDPDLDAWLARWHCWDKSRHERPAGYDSRSAVVGEYRNRSKYDEDGVDEEDNQLDMLFDTTRAVESLPRLQNWAIRENARDLALGYAVIRNPHLPTDPVEHATLLAEARRFVRRRLHFL